MTDDMARKEEEEQEKENFQTSKHFPKNANQALL